MPDKNHTIFIEFNFGMIGLRKDGILEVVFFDNAYIGHKECMFLLSTHKRLFEGEKKKLLVKLGKKVIFSREAIRFSQSSLGRSFSIKEAYVVKKFFLRILMAILLLIFHRTKVKVRVFKNDSEATLWLLK
jgi:hypothetical protein